MDPLTLTVKLVEGLAWPLASIALVVLLRMEIRRLLPLLKKIKAGPLEAEFERELKELRTEADVQFPKKAQSVRAKSELSILLKLAQISPRSAVLEAWQQVEAAVLRVPIMRSLRLTDAQSNSPATVARSLSGHGHISAEEFALFHELRALRNQVAHARQFNPTTEAALNYIELSVRLLAALERWPLTAPSRRQALTGRARLRLPLIPSEDTASLVPSDGEVLARAAEAAPQPAD